jgi:hypothetical protein
MILEHHPAIGTGGRDLAAVAQNFAAGSGLEAADDVEEGALAAAGRADNGEEFAVFDVEVEVLKDLDGAKAFAEAANLEQSSQSW